MFESMKREGLKSLISLTMVKSYTNKDQNLKKGGGEGRFSSSSGFANLCCICRTDRLGIYARQIQAVII